MQNKTRQENFEMKKELRADIMRSVWVPLYRSVSAKDGRYGAVGYLQETISVSTFIVPMDKRNEALKLEFYTIACEHAPHVEDGQFHSADEYESCSKDVLGIHPVLVQNLPNEPCSFYLHQDIVLGLGLKQEGDCWVCPEEDYEKVVEYRKSESGKLQGIFIRLEHLRDFLCAKDSGLLIATYQDRTMITGEKPDFTWTEDCVEENGDNHHWTGSITPITEDGNVYGSSTAVFWAGRKTSEPEDDVPIHKGHDDPEIESSSKTIEHRGKKLYQVMGRLWRNQWTPPAKISPRVAGDDNKESTVEFIVDGSGVKASGAALRDLNGWLWFKPTVVKDLLSKRHGTLNWYTRDTGGLGSSPTYAVHFGVNTKGLINLYAKDIYDLPDFQKRIWQAHNVAPDGKPSQELWDAQMRTRPASTHAPEEALVHILEELTNITIKHLGKPLLKHHSAVPGLTRHVHRFRGDSLQGLYALAKDLCKLITERLDTNLLKHYAPPPDKKIGSIKRLACFLDKFGNNGREVTAPLAGINALRQGDAHLPSADLNEAFELLKITDAGDYTAMAQRMIEMMCFTLATVAHTILTSKLSPHE